MAANRKFLQLAGSTLAKIAALNGENAVKARELLVATDKGLLILGTGSGEYKTIGAVIRDTLANQSNYTPEAGILFFDTTNSELYIGSGSAWERAQYQAIPLVTSATAGDLVKVKADGTLEDSGHAEADVQFKLTSSTTGHVLTADASGFMADSGTALADVQTKLGTFTAGHILTANDSGFMADSGTAAADVQTKVSGATTDNVASFTSNGFVEDSGIAKADIQTKLTTKTTGDVLKVDANGFMEDAGFLAADVQQKLTGHTSGNILTVNAQGFMADSGTKLDDTGTSASDLWSAAKITEYVTSSISGMSWQAPVKSVVTAPAGTPAEGDRYLVKATATGAFAGKEGKIAEYDGSSWVFTNPVDGMALFVEDTDEQYAYNGTAWVNISAGFTYTAGAGLVRSQISLAA